MSEAGQRLEAQSVMTNREVSDLRSEISRKQSRIIETEKRNEGLIREMNKVVAERDVAIKSAADLREEVKKQRGDIED